MTEVLEINFGQTKGALSLGTLGDLNVKTSQPFQAGQFIELQLYQTQKIVKIKIIKDKNFEIQTANHCKMFRNISMILGQFYYHS